MQRVVYILFLSLFLLNFLTDSFNAPRALTYLPDLLSGLIFIMILLRASKQRYFIVSAKYWVIFLVIIVEMLVSAVINTAPSGAMFAGLRGYFKYIPLFFLAAVYPFTEDQLKRQFIFLLILLLLQLPVSLYQRFILSANVLTGDLVAGTVNSSGILSIVMVCAISVALGFFLKHKLTRFQIIIILLFFSLPTMINETKATLFMLPIAVFIPVVCMPRGAEKSRAIRMSVIFFIAFLALFIPIYDYFIWDRYGYGIIEFFTMDGRFMSYMAPSTTGHDVSDLGRIDAIVLFFKELSGEPIKLLLGLGIGNVSESFLGSKFSGDYLTEYGQNVGGSLSLLLWETGVIGFILVVVLMFMIFRDVIKLVGRSDFSGALALGWTGVIPMMLFGLFYSKLIPAGEVSYLFWYFSGYLVVVATKMRIQLQIDRDNQRNRKFDLQVS